MNNSNSWWRWLWEPQWELTFYITFWRMRRDDGSHWFWLPVWINNFQVEKRRPPV